MSAPNDGGSVFPVANHATCIPSEGCRIQPGLTLRDYFAGQALAGLAVGGAVTSPETAANYCYRLADAMLAARGGR